MLHLRALTGVSKLCGRQRNVDVRDRYREHTQGIESVRLGRWVNSSRWRGSSYVEMEVADRGDPSVSAMKLKGHPGRLNARFVVKSSRLGFGQQLTSGLMLPHDSKVPAGL